MRLPVRWIIVALVAIGLVGAPLVLAAQARPSVSVTIPAEGYDLAGYLSEGEDPGGVWVIFVHGNRAEGQGHVLYRRIAGNLPASVSVLSIDLRGFGNSSSEGLEGSDRVLDRTGDIEAAADYLEATYGVQENQIVLMGHSLGALEVLKAGQSRRYRGVISIGPGDFHAFLADEAARRSYAAKLSAAMGIRVAERSIAEEGHSFLPQELFTPCPQAPTFLVYGAFDLEESLRRVEDDILKACSGSVRSVTIPLSDHMYGTEWGLLPGPIRSAASWLPVGLLLWNLQHLIPMDSS
jgi:pimeloyl-ACP methyl ester carboxylesterase